MMPRAIPEGKRFVIGQPGVSVEPTYLDQYAQWEVIDRNYQNRVCLTATQGQAQMIADALEVFHQAADSQKATK